MPQPTKGARLGGSPAHQRLILANLATSLFQHGKIRTTEAKAKRLRPYAERLISKAKRGDLHNRREIQKLIRDRETVHRLMHEIGPFFADRNGGYTRITKTLPRQGDNAPMAVIELVSQKTVTDEADRARRVAGSQGRRGAASAPAATAPAATEATASEETAADETACGRVRLPRPRSPTTGSATEVTADRNAVDEAEGSASEPVSDTASETTHRVRGAHPGFGGRPHGGRGGARAALWGRGASPDLNVRHVSKLASSPSGAVEPAVREDGGLDAVPAPFPGAPASPAPVRARTASTSPTTAPTSPAGRPARPAHGAGVLTGR